MKKKVCIDHDTFRHEINPLEKLVSFVTLVSPDVDVLIDKQCIIDVYNDLVDTNDVNNPSYDFDDNDQKNLDIFVEFC